jgi:DNA-3-methyladenine glycosylase I
MIEYHDKEWGVPVHDDRKLFEFLVLDTFQAGLSWRTILNKREGFDKAFAHFETQAVAQFGPSDVERLMSNAAIVRNRRKIEGTLINARLVIQIQDEFGSLDNFIWNMIPAGTHPSYATSDLVPATTADSDLMSKRMREYGFKFVGSTMCYAFMQGAGLVNDHLTSCYRYSQLFDPV